MDNYYDIEEPKKVKGFTIGKMFKFIFIAIFVLIYGTIVIRCTLANDDKIVSKVIYDDTTLSVYNSAPQEFLVQQYPMNSPWVAISEGRLIEFNYLYYLPAAKQLQFSVKFNLDIAEFYNTEGLPFDFSLRDKYGNTFNDYFFEYKEKSGYGYIRICFNDIVLEDLNAEPDENGIIPRNKFTVYIYQMMQDNTYSDLCSYQIYDGGTVSKNIKFDKFE